jgi:hypothetical protein
MYALDNLVKVTLTTLVEHERSDCGPSVSVVEV